MKKNLPKAMQPNATTAEEIIRETQSSLWDRNAVMERFLGQHMAMDGYHAQDGAGSWYWEALFSAYEEGESYYIIIVWRVDEAKRCAYWYSGRVISDLEALALLTKDNPRQPAKSNPVRKTKPFTGASALAKLKAIHTHRKSVLHKVVGEVPSPLQGTIAFRTFTEFGSWAYEADAVYEVVWVVYPGKSLTKGAYHQSIRKLSDLEVLSLLGDEAKANPAQVTQAELEAAWAKWMTPRRMESIAWTGPIYKGKYGKIYRDLVQVHADGKIYRLRVKYEAGVWKFSRRQDPPSELELLGLLEGGTKSNPKRRKANMPLEVYDPREEQLRAQRQAIYESHVKKLTGASSFRDARGQRADIKLPEAKRRDMIRRFMFAMGTGVQRRDGRLYPGTQRVAPKSAAEAAQRYSDVDALVRNRQDYEETLGLARKSGFYRATKEPTRNGEGFFVWPLPPGMRQPVQAANELVAQQIAAELNATADPRRTGRWWSPPRRAYHTRELIHWLPPASAFALPSTRQAALRRRKSA